VAVGTDGLQVLIGVGAAFRLRHNVVDLFRLADAPSSATRLAQVHVTRHHRIALAAPWPTTSPFAVVLLSGLGNMHRC